MTCSRIQFAATVVSLLLSTVVAFSGCMEGGHLLFDAFNGTDSQFKGWLIVEWTPEAADGVNASEQVILDPRTSHVIKLPNLRGPGVLVVGVVPENESPILFRQESGVPGIYWDISAIIEGDDVDFAVAKA